MREDGSVPFSEWLFKLRDLQAKTTIRRRIDRFAAGNPGNAAPARKGVRELKIDCGPGYRVYFSLHGKTLVVLLCGGDKSTQDADIETAIGYWNDWKKRNKENS